MKSMFNIQVNEDRMICPYCKNLAHIPDIPHNHVIECRVCNNKFLIDTILTVICKPSCALNGLEHEPGPAVDMVISCTVCGKPLEVTT